MDPQVPNRSELLPNKKGNISVVVMAIFVILSLSAVAFLWYQNQQLKKMILSYQTQSQPTPSPTPVATTDPTGDWKGYQFGTISLSFKAPQNLIVTQSEPNKGSDFTGYVQGENYQLYVFWQKSPSISKDEFALLKQGLITDSITESLVDGNYTINGQIKGQRNRFATYVLHNGNKISFLTSEPTEENRVLSNKIISTIKFLNTNTPDDPNVTSPLPNSTISSPLTITGTTTWMFEGQLPVKLVDSKGNLIAQGTAKEVTPGSWTKGGDVPFKVILPFSTEDSSGKIILMKDNPSGLPENDKSFEIPVKF